MLVHQRVTTLWGSMICIDLQYVSYRCSICPAGFRNLQSNLRISWQVLTVPKNPFVAHQELQRAWLPSSDRRYETSCWCQQGGKQDTKGWLLPPSWQGSCRLRCARAAVAMLLAKHSCNFNLNFWTSNVCLVLHDLSWVLVLICSDHSGRGFAYHPKTSVFINMFIAISP